MSDDHPTVVVQPPAGVVGVATETIGALRGSPILIVMVVLNCVFIGAAAFYFKTQQENVYRLIDKMFDRCLPDVHPEAYVGKPPHPPVEETRPRSEPP
jgi:hypothetical protein